LLEQAHMAAEGGLRNVKILCGAPQAATLRNGAEVPQAGEIDAHQ
jgi:hypothetical protein